MNKTVLHYLDWYLRITMTWVYGQITSNKEYKHVVACRIEGNREVFPVSGVHSLQSLSRWEQYYNRMWFRIFGYYPLFLQTARQESVSIIQAHFGHYGYKALALKKKLGVPMVTFFYGYEMSELARQLKHQWRFKKLFRNAEMFFVTGSAMKRDVVALGCPEEKVVVMPLGVDVANYPFHIRKVTANEKVKILFAANWTEKKGLDYTIKAFALAYQKNKNILLKIIGDGEDRPQILELLKQVNLPEAIEVKGYVPYGELINEMLAAHIFIQPSVTAKNGNTEGGYPISLLDAQATGMPVITTYHADNPESVVEGKSALLAPERDEQTLAAHLLTLAGHPERWESMGRAGRRHVEENYNHQVLGPRIAKIYDQLIKKGR